MRPVAPGDPVEGHGPVEGRWLGRVPYREAWALQHRLVSLRAAGMIPDQLLLLEHDAVLTLGRNADASHVRVLPGLLEERGIELIRVERGGEVTYHGPGQLVAYPIVHLAERGVLIRSYVRALEAAMAETAAAYVVNASRREGLPGLWVDAHGPLPRKLGAVGVRVERGVTYHGIALNVTTDLRDFGLIDPCGLPDIGVTSIAKEAGWPPERKSPSTDSVADAAIVFATALARLLGAELAWPESMVESADGLGGRAAAGSGSGVAHAADRLGGRAAAGSGSGVAHAADGLGGRAAAGSARDGRGAKPGPRRSGRPGERSAPVESR